MIIGYTNHTQILMKGHNFPSCTTVQMCSPTLLSFVVGRKAKKLCKPAVLAARHVIVVVILQMD